MEQFTRIGLDTSKRFFQLHAVDATERVVLRRKLSRDRMVRFFARLAPTEVAMEACGAAHHWGRELTRLGHRARLIAPQLAKPYVRRGKNDAADAAALCEAASRPAMRYVPIKTIEQQAALMLAGERERLVRERTRLADTIRRHAAEFGLIAERLRAVPGIGRVAAALLVMKTPDPAAFRCGRDFAAWLGLTPKDHSTAGKQRLGGITRAGDETPRSLLVVGAASVLW